MAEETATFALRIDADAEAPKEAAAELEKFRSAIQKSQGSLDSYRKSLSMLKGSSDEVADARAKLKAAIASEQAAVTKNNLAILKLGGSYTKLAKAAKDASKSEDGSKKAIAAIGGPAKTVSEKLEGLKTITAGASTGWGALAVGMSAGVLVLAAAAAAVLGLTLKLTDFTVTSADSLRSMRLMREAVSGNTENATAWGHQIDFLSLKLATSKDELNGMVVSLEKTLRGTRVSGQGMVDIFKAVATTSSAMGADTGKALESILTRGKETGRFWLGFKAPGISELQGLGITYEQVAAQLGKNLGIGTQAAKMAMMRGAVTMDQGARAVREVVEGRFADINAKKLVSLDSLWTKFKDNLRDFASDAASEGGALEPLLHGLKSVVDMFGLQTETGQRTKAAVTEYIRALSDGLQRNLPLIKRVIEGTIDLGIGFAHAVTAVMNFATSSTGLEIIRFTLFGIATAAGLVVAAFAAVGAGIALSLLPFYELYKVVSGLIALDWAATGKAIVDGIRQGLTAGWDALKGAVGKMGEGLKSEFKSLLGIASPSKVFATYGVQTAKGYAQGIDRGSGDVSRSSEAMAETAAAPAAAAPSAAPVSAGSSSRAEVKVILNFYGVSDRTAQQLQSQSLLDTLQQAVRAAVQSAGIPTGAPAPSGG